MFRDDRNPFDHSEVGACPLSCAHGKETDEQRLPYSVYGGKPPPYSVSGGKPPHESVSGGKPRPLPAP